MNKKRRKWFLKSHVTQTFLSMRRRQPTVEKKNLSRSLVLKTITEWLKCDKTFAILLP